MKLDFRRGIVALACVATMLLHGAVLTAQSFRVKQQVVLKTPDGKPAWALLDTCSLAYLSLDNAGTKKRIAQAVQADRAIPYVNGVLATVLDIESECLYVETKDGDAGWIDQRLAAIPKAETQRIAAQREAAAAKERAEKAYFASLPTLVESTGQVPVAVDEGCHKDVLKSKSLSGIALRKHFLELVQFGCAYLVSSGTHVTAVALGDAYSVVIKEGPSKDRTGVVMKQFVRFPPK